MASHDVLGVEPCRCVGHAKDVRCENHDRFAFAGCRTEVIETRGRCLGTGTRFAGHAIALVEAQTL
ncbi:MAG: hypothetical protein VX000_18450, partial [Myxococcota bacterium]|nr:hypothetical protein [Myxococcota bacterium]